MLFDFGKSKEIGFEFNLISKKTHPYLHKDGKNCYEKEITSKLVMLKYIKFFNYYENISLTFSKKDFSLFSGLGVKFSSVSDFSKNCFCSLFRFFGVQTFT